MISYRPELSWNSKRSRNMTLIIYDSPMWSLISLYQYSLLIMWIFSRSIFSEFYEKYWIFFPHGIWHRHRWHFVVVVPVLGIPRPTLSVECSAVKFSAVQWRLTESTWFMSSDSCHLWTIATTERMNEYIGIALVCDIRRDISDQWSHRIGRNSISIDSECDRN